MLFDFRHIPDEYKGEHISYEQNAKAPIFNMEHVMMLIGHYNPQPNDTRWNLFAPGAKHHGFPPTCFQVCGMDPLRDDALVFERVLKENGTKTKVEVYPGVNHGFWAFFPHMKLSQKFVEDTRKGMEWLLQQQA